MERATENIVMKEESAGQQYIPFPQSFLPYKRQIS